MLLRNIADKLLDQNRFSHARAAKQPNLAATRIGCNEVYHLDARFENLRRCILLFKRRCFPVNGHPLFRLHRFFFVDILADDIEEPSEDFIADRHGNRSAGINRFRPAFHAIRGRQRDAADDVISDMLGHFRNNFPAIHINVDRGQELRHMLLFEPDIHNGPDNLMNGSLIH